jgi:hypothetical protein
MAGFERLKYYTRRISPSPRGLKAVAFCTGLAAALAISAFCLPRRQILLNGSLSLWWSTEREHTLRCLTDIAGDAGYAQGINITYVFIVPFLRDGDTCMTQQRFANQTWEAVVRDEFVQQQQQQQQQQDVSISVATTTTSDDIRTIREILDQRELNVRARRRFSRKAFDAWYHAPLCPGRVLRLLRQWVLGEKSGRGGGGSNIAATTSAARRQPDGSIFIIIPAGPLLRLWSFQDIAFAQMLAPGASSRFVIVGQGQNLLGRMKVSQRHFRTSCTVAQNHDISRLTCKAPTDTDAWRFRFFEC